MSGNNPPQTPINPERSDMRRSLYRAFVLLFATALPALASNGVIEINQAKALSGGVTAGDTAGFPVTLSGNGSFILTSNLNLAVANTPQDTNAIEVIGESISIDLNGFAIHGITQCSPPHPVTCTQAGLGIGIEVPFTFTNLAVRNGTIRGHGKHGIHQENGRGSYEDLDVSSNGGSGLLVQNASVRRVRSQLNGLQGIDILEGAVSDSSAYLNKFDGIRATYAIVESCQSTNNGGSGFLVAVSTMSDSYANINQGTALSLSSSSWSGNTLLGCVGPCQTGGGNLQLGPNNCAGSTCP